MKRKLIALGRGGLSYLPGLRMIGVKSTGGTITARYCYSVWLRHLVKSWQNGLGVNPSTVAELGPGDSLGVGLAALISGADSYVGLDVTRYANTRRNLDMFDELVGLFSEQHPIPGVDEFPRVRPALEDYKFPLGVLDRKRMSRALAPGRLRKIRESLVSGDNEKSLIRYSAPWFGKEQIEKGSVDMLFSQAVLEHVDDLAVAYPTMRSWLKETGHMSHTIDFSSHGLADEWNGHWRYPDVVWRMIRGRRPWLINRQPCSVHLEYLNAAGMSLVEIDRVVAESRFDKRDLAKRFRHVRDEDVVTRGVFFQARIA